MLSEQKFLAIENFYQKFSHLARPGLTRSLRILKELLHNYTLYSTQKNRAKLLVLQVSFKNYWIYQHINSTVFFVLFCFVFFSSHAFTTRNITGSSYNYSTTTLPPRTKSLSTSLKSLFTTKWVLCCSCCCCFFFFFLRFLSKRSKFLLKRPRLLMRQVSWLVKKTWFWHFG